MTIRADLAGKRAANVVIDGTCQEVPPPPVRPARSTVDSRRFLLAFLLALLVALFAGLLLSLTTGP